MSTAPCGELRRRVGEVPITCNLASIVEGPEVDGIGFERPAVFPNRALDAKVDSDGRARRYDRLHVEHQEVEVLSKGLEEAGQIRFAAKVSVPRALARLDTIVAPIHIVGDMRYDRRHVPPLKCRVYVLEV